jgi:hypothetical protein
MFSFKESLQDFYRYTIQSGKFHYISDENPTINVNPEIENAIWLNRKTAETFVCVDNTPDKNIWKGSKGTIIAPTTLTKFDLFEDGSTIAVYPLDGNLHDLGGKYNGAPNPIRRDPVYEVGKFNKCVKSRGNLYNCKFHIPELESYDVITVSAWLNWTGSYSGIMPFGFYKYDIYIYGNALGFNTSCGDIYGIRNARNYYRKGWFHLVAEFHRGDVSKNKIWINGQKQDLYQIYSRPNNSYAIFKQDFYIFGWGISSGYRNFGMVDHVRLFKRALTDDEVLTLYNEH